MLKWNGSKIDKLILPPLPDLRALCSVPPQSISTLSNRNKHTRFVGLWWRLNSEMAMSQGWPAVCFCKCHFTETLTCPFIYILSIAAFVLWKQSCGVITEIGYGLQIQIYLLSAHFQKMCANTECKVILVHSTAPCLPRSKARLDHSSTLGNFLCVCLLLDMFKVFQPNWPPAPSKSHLKHRIKWHSQDNQREQLTLRKWDGLLLSWSLALTVLIPKQVNDVSRQGQGRERFKC